MILEYDKIVIGSSLTAVLYAFKHNLPLFFTEPRRPFRFDCLEPTADLSCLKIDSSIKTLKAFDGDFKTGIPRETLWERLLFLLSLNSKLPLSNLCHSIRCTDNIIICSNEYSKLLEVKFKTCYYFGDARASGFITQKTLEDKKYICYDWVAFNRGGKHEIDYIKTNDEFVSEIWFYPSDRIDGNTPVKDACAVSTLTESQLLDFDYSETMARFKLVHEMESRGMKGKFNGYSSSGRPKHYKFRTSSTYRQTNQFGDTYKPKSENIEIPQVCEAELLQDLQEACMGYDRFLRVL